MVDGTRREAGDPPGDRILKEPPCGKNRQREDKVFAKRCRGSRNVECPAKGTIEDDIKDGAKYPTANEEETTQNVEDEGTNRAEGGEGGVNPATEKATDGERSSC